MGKKVYVIPTGAFSFKKQAQLLGEVIHGYVFDKFFHPSGHIDTLILIGNIDVMNISIPYNLSFDKLILYTVIEGDFNTKPVKYLINKYKPIIITPSNYVKSLLESHGISVDAVIPHGIPYSPLKEIPKKDIDYLYIGEYQKRKIPPYGLKVLRALQDKLVLVSDFNNPYIKSLKVKEKYQSMKSLPSFNIKYATEPIITSLYTRTKFYLNISANEGFGLTPLESEAFGDIPITPRLPVFRETLGNCPYFLDIDENDIEIWNYGTIKIHLYRYDPEQLIKLAENSVYDSIRAKECMENASIYEYKQVYKRFNEFI